MAYSQYQTSTQQSSLLTKVFGWMALALGLTGVTAIGLVTLLTMGILSLDIYYAIVGIGTIVFFIVYLMIIFRRFSASSSSLAPLFFTYAITMGVILSPITVIYDVTILGQALGITALIFGMMALYGATTKVNLMGLGQLAMMAILGSFVLIIFNLFIVSDSLSWLISFVLFGAILLLVSYQVWVVRQLEMYGRNDQQTAMFAALGLYASFINIFLRVLQFIAFSRRR